MKKSAKAVAAISACAMCLVMAGGVAHAIAPSVEEAQDQVATETQTEQMAEAFSRAYATSAEALELSGVDENGNDIPFDAESPAITGVTPAVSQAASDEATEAEQPSLDPMCLVIFGNVIPYVDAYGATAAPASTAGLWMGNDSTTDGTWGYFIGHHPGVFNSVMYLSAGDTVTVCDRDGNAATYSVFAVYDVPNTTTWEEVSGGVTGYGESFTLQTCVGDGETYRIVQAA